MLNILKDLKQYSHVSNKVVAASADTAVAVRGDGEVMEKARQCCCDRAKSAKARKAMKLRINGQMA